MTTRQSPSRMKRQRSLLQASAIVAAAARVVFEQVPLIDPGGEQCIPLQVQHLPVAIGRDAHITDQHVRENLPQGFPHSAPFRQGLSCNFNLQTPPVSTARHAGRKNR